MVIHSGNIRLYDNFNMGAATPKENPQIAEGTTGIVFHDVDNDIVHIFAISDEQVDEWLDLVRQKIKGSGLVVASADQMPKGAPNGDAA